jgi:hypothetical protein
MKKSTAATIILAAGLCLGLTFSAFAAGNPVIGTGTQQRDLAYLYESPLTVYEEITDIGGGLFQYSYHFENVDNKNIWHFGIYTTFMIVETTSTWAELSSWGIGVVNDLDSLYPEYDPRNLNPDLVAVAYTYGPNWPFTTDPEPPRV